MEVLIEVSKKHAATQFLPVDPSDSVFSEGWLQETLRRYPEVLPVDEFGPVFHPLVSIGREVPTSAGPIDNLFISHSGYLVLVETKLWRNREARREVVAQLVDYATALTRMTYDELDSLTHDYLRKYEAKSSMSLEEWVEEKHGPVDIGFQGRVSRNLKRGRFLLLIVTDQERPTVVDMLKRLSKQAWLSIDMAVVALRPFRRQGDVSGNLLLIPQVAGRTEIVERSSVEVIITAGQEPQVTVRKEQPHNAAPGKTRAPLTSELAFWELMQDQVPESVTPARRLIDRFRDDQKFDLGLREASIVVETDVPGTDVAISLFFLKLNGVVGFWPGTIRRRLRAGGLSATLADEYIANMGMLWGASPNRKLYCEVDRIDIDSLRDIVDRFVKRIEEAQSAG